MPQTPPSPQETVALSAYLQDSYVEGAEPTTVWVDKRKVGDRLQGTRLEVRDPDKARADQNGNYLNQPPTAEFDGVTAFAAAQNAVDLAEQLADQPIPWQFNDRLGIVPHKGEGMNAFYVRQDKALHFYHWESSPLGKHIQVSQGADVVAHETGHALLDGLKPEFLYDWGEQSRSFHEAFGDCMAILVACSKPALVERTLVETEGNLLQDNHISRMAEEFGLAWRREWNPWDNHPYLRNGLNEYKYVPRETLPENGPVDSLNKQAHSYSQIFTGAFYRCLVAMSGEKGANLVPASQDLGRIFMHAVEMTAPSSTDFKQVARCMLTADRQLFGGTHLEQLKGVFQERDLLTPAEIQTWQSDVDSLPRLSKGSDPMRFLRRHQETLRLDASQYEHVRSTTDRQGRERWEFLSRKRVGPGEVQGGITLTFEPNGRLGWISRQDITPERIREALAAMSTAESELHADGLLRRTTELRD